MLEAARQLETPRIVHTSTSEVYGTARRVPIDEGHPLQAQSPYSASKIAADKLAESYHLSFGVPAVTLRPFNTFGPRQSARAVIPTIISQVAAGKPAVRLGATAPTRDFTFVTDTAAAFLAVGMAPAERVVGRTLNAGTGTEVSIGDVVTLIGQLMDRTVDRDRRDRAAAPGCLRGDAPGERQLTAARAHRLATRSTRSRMGCARPSAGSPMTPTWPDTRSTCSTSDGEKR